MESSAWIEPVRFMNASPRRLAPPLLALLLGLAGGCGWKLDPGPAPLVLAQRVPVLMVPGSHPR